MKITDIKKTYDEITFQPFVECTIQIPLEPFSDPNISEQDLALEIGLAFIKNLKQQWKVTDQSIGFFYPKI